MAWPTKPIGPYSSRKAAAEALGRTRHQVKRAIRRYGWDGWEDFPDLCGRCVRFGPFPDLVSCARYHRVPRRTVEHRRDSLGWNGYGKVPPAAGTVSRAARGLENRRLAAIHGVTVRSVQKWRAKGWPGSGDPRVPSTWPEIVEIGVDS